MCGTVMRGADALPGSKATSRAKGSHRNLGDLVSGRRRRVLFVYGGPHREGEEPKPMMHGHEKSDFVIVAVKPTNKARKALCGGVCGGGRSGVGGAKGGGQGEYAPAKHVLDSEPGSRVTGAGAAALEDKIVQRAVAGLLNAIYEEDFLGPLEWVPGRGVARMMRWMRSASESTARRSSYILDADIRSFFDEISHDWLIRFLEHRSFPGNTGQRERRPKPAWVPPQLHLSAAGGRGPAWVGST